MNKKIFVLVMVLCLIPMVYAETNSDIRISLLSQEPDPAAPGEYIDLRFKIENFGEEALNDVFVKLEARYPFSLDGSDDAEKYLGTIFGGMSEDSGTIVKYKVKVDSNAISGNNKIKISYRSRGSLILTSAEFDISVRAIYDQIFIDKIVQNPQVLFNGQVSDITFYLTNYGDTLMKDITITIDLSASTTPLVPYSELSNKRLKTLKPGETGTLSFKVKANPDAVSQLYKIPITLKYNDILNNAFTKNDILGVEIGGKPNLLVTLEQSSIYTSGSTGDIVLNIINNGETNIKFLNLIIPQKENFVIIEGKEQYIGNLNSDDFETAKVKVHLNGNSTSFKLPVKLEYENAL
jgi:hypothetical protein